MPASVQPTFKFNPYVEKLAYRIKTKKKAGYSGSMRVVDQDTGDEGPELAYFAKTKEVDDEQFVKLYADGIDMLCNLDTGSIKVLRVFIRAYTLDKHNFTDTITMPYRWAVHDYGYPHTQQSWIKGLNKLGQADVLSKAAGSPNVFFLNPEYFIKGDRLALVHEFRRRSITERAQA